MCEESLVILKTPRGPVVESQEGLDRCRKKICIYFKDKDCASASDVIPDDLQCIADNTFESGFGGNDLNDPSSEELSIIAIEPETSGKRLREEYNLRAKKKMKSVAPTMKMSLRPSQMLSLGTVPEHELGKVQGHYLLKSCTIKSQEESYEWKPLKILLPSEISVDSGFFDQGTFRAVTKARIEGFSNTYCVKSFRQDASSTVVDVCGSDFEEMAYKAVQVSVLSSHMLSRFKAKVCDRTIRNWRFNECFILEAKCGAAELYPQLQFPVMIEPFITSEEGMIKFINNNGEFDRSVDTNILVVLEAFVHFVYSESMGQIMPLDLQGFVFTKADFVLTDPEIASTSTKSTSGDWRYTCGNLSVAAMDTFKSIHQCGKLCQKLKLKAF